MFVNHAIWLSGFIWLTNDEGPLICSDTYSPGTPDYWFELLGPRFEFHK